MESQMIQRSFKQQVKAAALSILGPKLFILALKIFYFGLSGTCIVCGSSIRKRFDQGHRYPVLGRLQVVGGFPKKNDVCPICRSSSRTRLIHHYIITHNIIENVQNILHIAPERGITMFFLRRYKNRYTCADLEPDSYISLSPIDKVDVTQMPYGSEVFDLVICNHVFEHIVDDLAAMSEIRRVLHRNGLAILQVPFSLNLTQTREGLHADTDDDRIALYGQKDHIRIYTLHDYVDRLNRSGFDVTLFHAYEVDAEMAMNYELDPLEPLILCRPRIQVQ